MVVTADAVAPSAAETIPGFGVAIRANILRSPEAVDETEVTWTMAGGKVTYAS